MSKQATKHQGKQRKIEAVSRLKEKLVKAKAFFLTEYRGLTHPQLETLRKTLKKADAEYVVTKNRLMKLAIKGSGTKAAKVLDQLEKALVNPTATLLAYGDEIAPIKALANFIKTLQLPKIKIGFFGGNVATEADFTTLASLPTREVLLATLATRLQSPIQGFHYALSWNLKTFVTVLSNIKDKKNLSS